jgi:hypothetical protein
MEVEVSSSMARGCSSLEVGNSYHGAVNDGCEVVHHTNIVATKSMVA